MKACLLLGWLLTGCAVVYDGIYDYEQGWRTAVVEQANAAVTASAGLDCRSAAAPAAARYLYVRYEVAMRPRHAIVLAPEEGAPQAGQQVYINVNDCARPAVLPSRDG